MNKRITLADLAEKTGLNVSTVSRALSRPNRVSTETRQLVQKVATELGYAVNIVARNLSRGTSDTILVLAPSFSGQAISPVFTQILLGVCEEATSLGLRVMLQQCLDQTLSANDVIQSLRAGVADSALIVAAQNWMPSLDREPDEESLPVVSIMKDLTAEGLTSVTTQEADGFVAIVDHLLRRGHKRFAYIAGPKEIKHEEIRYRAVCDRLTAHGYTDNLVRLEGGQFDMPSGVRAAERFLELPERPSAVICCSDALALGFLHVVQGRGLRVPDDVAVTGYDGMDYTGFTTPALTTVAQPTVEIGRVAVQALADLKCGRITRPRLVSLSPTFIPRQSS
ncbi:LacI family DNA-binding transcriptional regulator [Acetobacter sp. KSO5]|uniref:LacI family DNA-binding transcriptional regulator n=1 Tax=Acetobacter sp. KSO5 TaxID=3373674 RepID=UPI00376F0CA2